MSARRAFAAVLVAMMVALTGLSGCGGAGAAADTNPLAARSAAGDAKSPPARAASAGVRHYEYVFPDQGMYVYDIDHGFKLVQHVALPGVTGIRGIAFAPRTHILYISHGGDSGGNGDGSLLAYDLPAGKTLWDRSYHFGVDSMAISRDGSRIYMPDGELATNGTWYVLGARSGAVIGTIEGGEGPHNTVVGPSGRHVYLGGRNGDYLDVASTATDRVIRRIGPLRSGVRPFTVNGRETLAYTTATGFLGFQVSSIRSGRVRYTETFGPRFTYDPARYAPSAPSHGISLTPNGRQLWVLDGPNSYLHVFNVSGVPRRAPRRIADVRLRHGLSGNESPCSYDCARDGWLQSSRSGCYVFAGDSGDVISTVTFRPVAFLPALRETRKMLEIDWRGGVPFATSTRIGVGALRAGRRRPRCS